jgi:hypothetical protein
MSIDFCRGNVVLLLQRNLIFWQFFYTPVFLGQRPIQTKINTGNNGVKWRMERNI